MRTRKKTFERENWYKMRRKKTKNNSMMNVGVIMSTDRYETTKTTSQAASLQN